jgi:hypothetical protein
VTVSKTTFGRTSPYLVYLVVTMPHGSYSLGETAAKQKMVRLVCDKCGRRGQYRVDRLLEQYGPGIAMPDLRHELAQCPHRRDMSNPCEVEYVDSLADF